NGLVEPDVPAVQVVSATIHSQFVFDAVEREMSFGDTVGVTARDGAEEWMAFQVFIQVVEAEHDVIHLATSVGGFERNDYASVVGDPRLDAIRVGQRVNLHILPVLRLSEIILLQGGFPLSAETAQKRADKRDGGAQCHY